MKEEKKEGRKERRKEGGREGGREGFRTMPPFCTPKEDFDNDPMTPSGAFHSTTDHTTGHIIYPYLKLSGQEVNHFSPLGYHKTAPRGHHP